MGGDLEFMTTYFLCVASNDSPSLFEELFY